MDYSVFTYLILISKGVPSRKHGPKNYCRGRAASKVVAQFTSTDTAAWAHDILSPHAASVGDCFYNRCLPHQLLLTPLFFHRGGEPDESRAARCSAPRIRPAYGPPRAGRRRRGWGSSSPWRGKQSRGGLGAWVPASQYAVGRWEGGRTRRGAGQGRAGDEGPAAIQHLLLLLGGAVAEGALVPAVVFVDPPPVPPGHVVGPDGGDLSRDLGRGRFRFGAGACGGSFLVALAGAVLSQRGPVSSPVRIPVSTPNGSLQKWGIFFCWAPYPLTFSNDDLRTNSRLSSSWWHSGSLFGTIILTMCFSL